MKGKKMSNVLDMAEAHLLNVQRELQNLNQKKQEIDQEIEKLTGYLNEGVQVVNTAKSEANAVLAEQTDSPDQDDDRPF
jgi:flagellar biosynthesis chaperone FliJ